MILVTATITAVPTAAITRVVVVTKIKGHSRKTNELTELSKSLAVQDEELQSTLKIERDLTHSIIRELNNIRERITQMYGEEDTEIGSPETLPREPVFAPEPVPYIMLEPVPDIEFVDPYDLRQHKSIFVKNRTVQELVYELYLLWFVFFASGTVLWCFT